jgi:large subunit ribosomal protein L21
MQTDILSVAALNRLKRINSRLQSEIEKKRGATGMTAIIETGGKQYKVSEGDVLYIEKLNVAQGDSVLFDKVLAVVDGGSSRFGAPYVEGASVEANVIKNGKSRKIVVFKYKAKKNYKRKAGHRQPYTKVQITSIKA